MNPMMRLGTIAFVAVVAIGGTLYVFRPAQFGGPSTTASPTGSPLPSTAPASLEGTWETTFTRQEMLTAGIADAAEDDPSNYGHFKLAISAGLVLTVHLDGPQDTSAGRYVARGGTFTSTTLAGETFSLSYAVSSTTLTFAGNGPVTLRAKPWTRVAPASIEGTWETSFTRDEMLAAGIVPGEDDASNYGHFTLAIHDGGSVLTQLDGPKLTGRAACVVHGSSFTSASTNGEVFTWSFTATDTTLTFQGGPVTLRVKPWTRIGP